MRIFLCIVCILLPIHAAFAAAVQEVKEAGLSAYLLQDKSLPLIAVRIAYVGAGGVSDPAGKEGRALLASQLFDQGAKARNAQAFQQALEESAIRFSVSVDNDNLFVSLETLSENREKAFDLLMDALAAPRFDAEDVVRVKAQQTSRIVRAQDRPEYIADRALRSRVFAGHPYARPLMGTAESLARITRDDIAAYTKEHIAQNVQYVSVVGDITPEQTRALLTRLSRLPAQAQSQEIPVALYPAKGHEEIIRRDVPQTVVQFALPGIAREDKDYLVAYVLNHILGGSSLNSRLGDEIREKRGLTYAIDTELDPMRYGPWLIGMFATRNEAVQQALVETKNTLARLREHGITKQELVDAQAYITGIFPVQLDANSNIAGFLLSMQLYGLGIDYLDKRNALINTVTIEQVNAMIKRLITPEQMQAVLVGAPAKVTP